MTDEKGSVETTRVSFVASMILGLSSSLGLPTELMLQLLIIDIIVGLAAFIVFTVLHGRIHSLILSMDASFLSAINKLNYFRKYFDTDLYFLERIKEEKITSFYNYGIFAQIAAQVQLIDNFEKMIESRFFRRMRNDLQIRLQETRKAMRCGMRIYVTEKKRSWDKNGIDWKLLRYVHEDFFKYYGYRIDELTGERK